LCQFGVSHLLIGNKRQLISIDDPTFFERGSLYYFSCCG
jgi:hypothetical protein